MHFEHFQSVFFAFSRLSCNLYGNAFGKRWFLVSKFIFKILIKIMESLPFRVRNLQKTKILSHMYKAIAAMNMMNLMSRNIFKSWNGLKVMFTLSQTSKREIIFHIWWGTFSQILYVARKALRMSFWDVSNEANAVFKRVCPCLKRFLFCLKPSISKDNTILHF